MNVCIQEEMLVDCILQEKKEEEGEECVNVDVQSLAKYLSGSKEWM